MENTIIKKSKPKQARIEIRPTLEQKELLEFAAQLRGTTLASFILTNAIEKAQNVAETHKNVQAIMEARRREISDEAKRILEKAKKEVESEKIAHPHSENVKAFQEALENIYTS